MAHRAGRAQRLVALFVLGWLLFTFPLLAVFDSGGTVFGIPRLFAWLLGAWAALIVAMSLVAGRRGP